MQSINKLILLTALLFYTSASLAQEKVNKGDMIIYISTTNQLMNVDRMDIYKQGTKVNIVYRKFNRIDFAKVDQDSDYINLHIDLKKFDPQKFNQTIPIFDRHTIYDTTKVTVDLKADTAYYKILQLVDQSSKQELETSKVGERVILDGFGFSCRIITDSGIKNIGIHTPMVDSHPVITALLEESYDRLWPRRKIPK